MEPNSPAWDLWRSFLAVCQTGSLSGAARTLGLTQPTVGRQMDTLEARLGVALFTRSPTGLLATGLAKSLIPQAEAMSAAAESLVRAASGASDAAQGTVRVSCSEIVGVHVLPSMLATFRRARPGVDIELDLSNRNADLLRRDADIAVRMTRPAQDALMARRIGAVPIGLYAHRAYAQARGLPLSAAELRAHDLIGLDKQLGAYAGLKLGGVPVTREAFSFRADNDVAQLAAVRAGLGIGVCQVPLARDDGDLIPVLAGEIRFELEMWLVTHEDLWATLRVRLLFDHLADALTRWLAAPP